MHDPETPHEEDLVPLIPPALVEWLERMIPDRVPDVSEEVTLQSIHVEMGRQDVVRLLRAEMERQTEPEKE